MSAPGAPTRDRAVFDERAFQEAIELGENYRAQLAAVEEQRALIANVASDYRRARDALEAMKSSKAGDEVLLPVGGGTFVHATLANAERVISTLGAGVAAETAVGDALKRLDERLESVADAERRLVEETRRLESELAELSAHVQSMTSDRR